MDMSETPTETMMKRFQSFQPPILKGTVTSDDCENWLEDIEILFDFLKCTDERRVKLIGQQLHEVAKSWWLVIKEALEQRVSYRQDKGAEFTNLKQGQLNIDEYLAKFSTLLRFASHVARNDEAIVDQFLNGMNPEILTLVNVERSNNLADALI
ncbi:uncharacterized protein [Primulina eburnea]|uniref:uncharacterized protein n=1 Tax=Primulina eburnea TaxID=1245227 RepID=UPI003C6C9845